MGSCAMKDKFTENLQTRLSAFVKTASIETLSAAFAKANFEGYRHLKGSFFGLASKPTDGKAQATPLKPNR